MDLDADEPLLHLPIPLTPIHPTAQHGSMLTTSFIAQGDGSDENNWIAEVNYHLELLQTLGKPYATSMVFWTQSLPLSLILGVFLGFGSAGMLIVVHSLMDHWFVAPDDFRTGGEVWWLVINSSGGLLSGLALLSHGSIKGDLIRTIFHDVRHLRGNPIEAPFVVATTVILMATGAPLGPELALSSLASALAAILSSQLKLTRRTETVLVQSGLAGSFGTILLSPILGVSLLQELSVASRHSDILLDTLTLSERGVPRDILAHQDHDWMEQISLAGTASLSAFVVFKLLSQHTSLQWLQISDLGEDTFEIWHLVAVIPVGLFCGIVGAIAVILIALFRSFRSSTCNFLHSNLKLPKWIGILVFSALGGTVHGLISIWNPMLVGTGSLFVARLLREEVTLSNVPRLLASAFGKLVSMSACIGFGLVGGPIFPLAFVGMCLGMAMTPILPISLAVPCCLCGTVGSLVPIPFTLVFFTAFSMSLSVNQTSPVFVTTLVAFTLVGGLGIAKKLGHHLLGYIPQEVDLAPWLHTREDANGDTFQYEFNDEEADEDEDERAREIRSAVFGDARPMW